MKKFFGSVCHIISLLLIVITIFYFIQFLNYLTPCKGLCLAIFLDWRIPFIHALASGTGALLFYMLGAILKKKASHNSDTLQKTTKQMLLQISGWIGIILIIGAYFMLSFSFFSPESLLYQGMNILGSIGIAIEAFSKKDYQPFVLQIVWILIATIAILKIVL